MTDQVTPEQEVVAQVLLDRSMCEAHAEAVAEAGPWLSALAERGYRVEKAPVEKPLPPQRQPYVTASGERFWTLCSRNCGCCYSFAGGAAQLQAGQKEPTK